jgi:hypothetical protein
MHALEKGAIIGYYAGAFVLLPDRKPLAFPPTGTILALGGNSTEQMMVINEEHFPTGLVKKSNPGIEKPVEGTFYLVLKVGAGHPRDES